jgi:hypothetical protein
VFAFCSIRLTKLLTGAPEFFVCSNPCFFFFSFLLLRLPTILILHCCFGSSATSASFSVSNSETIPDHFVDDSKTSVPLLLPAFAETEDPLQKIQRGWQ